MKIEKGIEVVREIKSITEIGFSLEQLMPPAIFWPQYDMFRKIQEQAKGQ
jgi:hypothetical protein